MDLRESSSEKTTIPYLLNPPEVQQPPTNNSIPFLTHEEEDDIQIIPSPKGNLAFVLNPSDAQPVFNQDPPHKSQIGFLLNNTSEHPLESTDIRPHGGKDKKRKRSEDKLNYQDARAWPKDIFISPPPKKKGKRVHNPVTPDTIKKGRNSIIPTKWRIIKNVLIKHGLDEGVAENLKSNEAKPWGTRKGSSKKRKRAMNELIDIYNMSYKEVGAALGLKESSIQIYRAKSH